MYIISKHKDYYDGVVGSVGMDKTIVYERELIEITDNQEIPKQFKQNKYSWNEHNPFLRACRANIDHKKTNHNYDDVRGFIIGFCGKLYLGWKFDYKTKDWNADIGNITEIIETDIVYGYDKAKEFLKTDYWRSNLNDDINYVMNYNPIELFRKFKTPIFVYDSDSRRPRTEPVFLINPILKDYEFYKVVDAFTAFTELQMFISGVLGTGEKKIIEVEDKYKIGQHGFDKWSFRKEPQNK